METTRKLPALGRAGGKTILLGEHAVVYGGTAVAVPVTALELRVLLDTGEGWRAPTGDTDVLDRALAAILEAAGWDGPSLFVDVRSTLPLACGLGSSAALCVALARAVLTAQRSEHSLDRLRELANAGERVFHGNPSGVDVATIVLGRPIRFRKGEPPQEIAASGRFDLWIVDTGVRSRTSEVVAGVAQLRAEEAATFEIALRHIADSVAAGLDALDGGDSARMAAAMDHAMEGLRAIDVSHPVIEEVIREGVGNGALSGKLSGAGRGGVVLLLAPDPAWDPGPEIAGCPVLTRVTLA